jgi:hypothetical protein
MERIRGFASMSPEKQRENRPAKGGRAGARRRGRPTMGPPMKREMPAARVARSVGVGRGRPDYVPSQTDRLRRREQSAVGYKETAVGNASNRPERKHRNIGEEIRAARKPRHTVRRQTLARGRVAVAWGLILAHPPQQPHLRRSETASSGTSTAHESVLATQTSSPATSTETGIRPATTDVSSATTGVVVWAGGTGEVLPKR